MDALLSPETFMPEHVAGILILLNAVNGDLEKLSQEQVARIRDILHLDDCRSIQDLLLAGEL
ncbi:MAG TPA: hypothetical protein PKM50_08045 [Methanoregula sp.]|nr:hypothetical protein [Methanoregula sp.]